jgi:pectate lyase
MSLSLSIRTSVTAFLMLALLLPTQFASAATIDDLRDAVRSLQAALNAQATPVGEVLGESWSDNRNALVSKVVGFAEDVTGGKNGSVCRVTSRNDSGSGTLRDCATKGNRWVVFDVSGTISLNSPIRIANNTTIDGSGADITLTKNGLSTTGRENIIIHNLKIKNVADDGIKVYKSDTIWIDHVSVSNASDGAIDITEQSRNVTVSNSHLFDQNKTMLIGANDSRTEDEVISVTLHHNWFDGTTRRNPLVRYGSVHMFNNVLSNWGTGSSGGDAVNATYRSEVLLENNVFDAGANKTATEDIVPNWTEVPGFIKARGNLALNGAKIESFDADRVFTASNRYRYQLAAATQGLMNDVKKTAGWQPASFFSSRTSVTQEPNFDDIAFSPKSSIVTASNISATSDNFRPDHEADNLFDRCIGDGATDCSTGTDRSERFWIEFDLGTLYDLDDAHLFGDTTGNWQSRQWSVQYKAEAGDDWSYAFRNENAFGNRWFTESVDETARYIRLTVNGTDGNGSVQAMEFALDGTKTVDPVAEVTEEATEEPVVVETTPTTDREALLNNVVGFAEDVTGGKNGALCRVTSRNDSGSGTLRDCATKGKRWVVFDVSGIINLRSPIRIANNTTIDGRGADITLTNHGLTTNGRKNIIIHNLQIANVADDGIKVYDADTIWIDHVSVSNASDGAIDITEQSKNVTVSWSYLTDQNKTMLIGANDSRTADKAITVTLHSNWFDNTIRRNPLIRFGSLHMYNNLISDWGSGTGGDALNSTHGAQVLLENNIFDAGSNKTATEDTVPNNIEVPGYINARGNLSRNGAKVSSFGANRVFEASDRYAYRLAEASSNLENTIKAYAGWQPASFFDSRAFAAEADAQNSSGNQIAATSPSAETEEAGFTPKASIVSAANITASSDNFRANHAANNLFDRCIGGGETDCSTGTDRAERFWIQFDLGALYDLDAAHLFGDTDGNWHSRNWSIQYKENARDSWEYAFRNDNAFGNRWFTESVNETARYIRLTVDGTSGNSSVQAMEFALEGTKVNGESNNDTTISDTSTDGSVTSGDRVQTTDNLNVRSSASGDLIGVQSTGARGTIDESQTRVERGGYQWVYVNFATGPDGWVAEEFLTEVVSPSTRSGTLSREELISLIAQLTALIAAQQGN